MISCSDNIIKLTSRIIAIYAKMVSFQVVYIFSSMMNTEVYFFKCIWSTGTESILAILLSSSHLSIFKALMPKLQDSFWKWNWHQNVASWQPSKFRIFFHCTLFPLEYIFDGGDVSLNPKLCGGCTTFAPFRYSLDV